MLKPFLGLKYGAHAVKSWINVQSGSVERYVFSGNRSWRLEVFLLENRSSTLTD